MDGTSPSWRPDAALACCFVLEMLALGASPVVPAELGCWWLALWLPPVVLAASRAWTSRARRRAHVVAVLLVGYVAMVVLEAAFGHLPPAPWWTGHAAIALLLVFFARTPLVRANGRSASRELTVVALAVLAVPWWPRPAFARFWYDCLRLRYGMTIDETLAVFDGYYVQEAGTEDTSARLPVEEGLRGQHERFVSAALERRASLDVPTETVVYMPYDGENVSADICWLTFVDGRLVGRWISPD